jgi:hypothetical protein
LHAPRIPREKYVAVSHRMHGTWRDSGIHPSL